jgi:hypothetical protein
LWLLANTRLTSFAIRHPISYVGIGASADATFGAKPLDGNALRRLH